MSQTTLGKAVDLTFQQIQKYERGSNRMGSSRLYEFAKVLDVPVSHFFDEMPNNALVGKSVSGSRGRGRGGAGSSLKEQKNPLIKRETLELVRAYYKIRQEPIRRGVFNMVKAVGTAKPVEATATRKRP